LNKNKGFIKGVSVNPLFLYRNGKFTEPYIEAIEKLSNESIERNELDNYGFMLINLSKEIDIEKAKELSFKISKLQMNIGDYYDLKSVSYYSRKMDFETFKEIVSNNISNNELLPFNIGN